MQNRLDGKDLRRNLRENGFKKDEDGIKRLLK